jgi:nicotinate-nucleotide adenylyltransferase
LQSPEHELFFLVGADILPELPRWREPRQIVQLARLVVVNRPGAPVPDLDRVEAVLPGVRERVERVDIPGVDVSSSEIRRRVAAGEPIRYLTPPAVEHYIMERRLYRHRRSR